MSAEIGIGYFLPEASMFINQWYVPDEDLVEEYKKLGKSKETGRLRASTYLYNELWNEAERVGIKNLPSMLSAVIQLESDLSPEQKRLNPEKYLQVLVKGELREAIKNANDPHHMPEVKLHVERAEYLADVLEFFEIDKEK